MNKRASCLLPAVFPIPEFHALACPHCDKYKMYPHTLAGIEGFKCSAPDTECGKFMSALEAKQFIGMSMVKE